MPNDFVEKIKREERLKEMFSDGNSKISKSKNVTEANMALKTKLISIY